jgi:hypothetical protein
MCYPKPCTTCSKITWAGCGRHVADVRASVPADQWCAGHEGAVGDSWLRRLLGR